MSESRATARLLMVLLLILMKAVLVSLVVPPGYVTNETAHYRAAEAITISGSLKGSATKIAHREVYVLRKYAEAVDGHVPGRSHAEFTRLGKQLTQPDSRHRVGISDISPRASISPAYSVFLSRIGVWLSSVELRWRWTAMRFLNVCLMLVTALLVYLALRTIFAEPSGLPLLGCFLIGFGPWAGVDSVLLGSAPLLAVLWAAWLWRMSALLKKPGLYDMILVLLIALAMSSVGVEGLTALVCTLGASIFLFWKGRDDLGIHICIFAVLLSLIGIVLWIPHAMSGTAPVGVPEGLDTSWVAMLFGATSLPLGSPPKAFAIFWAVMFLISLSGIMIWALKGRSGRKLVAVSMPALIGLILIAVAWPGAYFRVVAAAPLLAVIMAAGLGAVSDRRQWLVTASVGAIVLLDWAVVLLWLVSGLYS